MNKKAIISFNVMNFIPKIIFLVVVVLSIVFIVKSFVVTDIDIRSAEAYVLINRIIYSPYGIAYYDKSIDRVYPGIIDLANFNTQRLEKAIVPVEHIAAKLSLVNQGKRIFYNEGTYNNLYSMLNVEGGSKEITNELYVLVKDGDKLKSDILHMSVVVK